MLKVLAINRKKIIRSVRVPTSQNKIGQLLYFFGGQIVQHPQYDELLNTACREKSLKYFKLIKISN